MRQLFNRFGQILDVRHFADKGFAFVRFGKKDSAARAICDMNGTEFMGQNIRCSWGKSEVCLRSFMFTCRTVFV